MKTGRMMTAFGLQAAGTVDKHEEKGKYAGQ